MPSLVIGVEASVTAVTDTAGLTEKERAEDGNANPFSNLQKPIFLKCYVAKQVLSLTALADVLSDQMVCTPTDNATQTTIR